MLGWIGADQEVKKAHLVLEPRNGGDARAEAPGQYLVEQYKTRANGTWALTDVWKISCMIFARLCRLRCPRMPTIAS